jgi:uncharacterized RDD family membrane protein YckC
MSWVAVTRNWKRLLVSKSLWFDPVAPGIGVVLVLVAVLLAVPVAVLLPVLLVFGTPPDGLLFVVRWYEAVPFTCGNNAARLS